jgi:hypothetical protein
MKGIITHKKRDPIHIHFFCISRIHVSPTNLIIDLKERYIKISFLIIIIIKKVHKL